MYTGNMNGNKEVFYGLKKSIVGYFGSLCGVSDSWNRLGKSDSQLECRKNHGLLYCFQYILSPLTAAGSRLGL